MHAGTLPQPTAAALAVLGKAQILGQAYLAGGTALALHLGHRRSRDLDFFSREVPSVEQVAVRLSKAEDFSLTKLEPPHTLLGIFNQVRFALFHYDYPLLQEPESYSAIPIASLADIAAMKLTAICGRATKRDYADLYVICRHRRMEQLFDWYDQQYARLANNAYTLVQALGYFDDAEEDEMPEMLEPVSWEEIKQFFSAESLRLGKMFMA
jgi:hypothetical protein